jgi:hypothetical protein
MLRANLLQTSKLTMVYPERKTKDGLWVSCEPYMVLANTPTPIEVGQAIYEALKLSRGLEATPIDWKKRSAPRLAAAGVKTEAAFQRGSKLVSIELEAGHIGFVAQHNGGTIGDTKGFTPIKGELISLPELAGPFEVGSVALASLTQCTSEA